MTILPGSHHRLVPSPRTLSETTIRKRFFFPIKDCPRVDLGHKKLGRERGTFHVPHGWIRGEENFHLGETLNGTLPRKERASEPSNVGNSSGANLGWVDDLRMRIPLSGALADWTLSHERDNEGTTGRYLQHVSGQV